MSTLEALRDASAALDQQKTDYNVEVGDLIFDRSGCMVVPAGMFNGRVALVPTDYAMSQICYKLGPPQARYISQCPTWLQAENLNYWREQLPADRVWFVRAYEINARAVLSDKYVTVGNTDLLDWAIEFTRDKHPLIRPYLDPDTLHVKIQVMNATGGGRSGSGNGGEPPAYAFGFYLGNGEIGNRALRVLPFIQRTACSNSIIMGDGFVQNHIYTSIPSIRAQVKEHMGRSLKVARARLDEIWRAEEELIPDFNDVVKSLSKQQGFSEDIRDDILVGSEGRKTRMGLVNGLSWAAHQQEDHELEIDMETLAGSILVSRDSLFGRASQVVYAEALVARALREQAEDERLAA